MTSMTQPAIPELWPWATETLLPFWATTGFDDNNACFVEQVSLDGVPHDPGFTRFRVQARQTYVFAHAHCLGVGDYALPKARAGFAFMQRCWNDRDGGFAMRITRDAQVVDPTVDLYDQAFALLALAWLHRATGEAEPLDWAERVRRLLLDRMAEPGGGFVEQLPIDPGKPRRQNPHMHLLEAFLALHAATGASVWLDLADDMVGLLVDYFLDPAGTLAEFFEADWRPRPGGEGRVREPGHQFEWVWLLNRYQAQGGTRAVEAVGDRLMAFAIRHGMDRTDNGVFAAFDSIAPDGEILSATKRFWPQTEAIRAFAVMHERTGDPDAATIVWSLFGTLFAHYLTPDSGVLRDGLSRDGRTVDPFSPSSSLYHLWGAIVEAQQVPRP